MENEYYKLIPSKTKKEIRDYYESGLKSGFSKIKMILRICQDNDLIFDQTVIDGCRDIRDYMKKIHLFKQYENKVFKNSILFLKEDETDKEFSKDILEKGLNTYNSYNKDLIHFQELQTCKLDLLSALRNEQQILLEKMKENMENGNMGTYKNLILALKEITYLIHGEEWTQKWSKYSCEDKEYVAVWEQKGSEIKNHKTFEIKSYKN